MRFNCKLPGAQSACPKDRNLCCHSCDDRVDCNVGCDDKPNECCNSEIITPPISFESAVPETLMRIASLMRMKKQLEDQEKELKKQLTKAMEEYGIKSYENDTIKMTYVAPTTRNTIDSTRLKKDHPELVEEYTKVSNVSASVRVTVKGDV